MTAPSAEGGALSFEALCELVAERVAGVRGRIAASGGDPVAVRLVAVTKTFPPEAALAALAAGVTDLGENYADELVHKAAALAQLQGDAAGGARWHFLGSVQRNKLGRLAPVVAHYDSVDRLAEGAAIARRRPGASVLVEVDTAGTPGREGIPPAEVPALVASLQGLELVVEGLMTVAPPEREAAAAAFALVDRLRRDLGLAEASMGMSEDLELAVAAGSTMVRIGRALFGLRGAPAAVSQ